MRNMKIEINEQQSLGEVVAELERLGYKPLNHLSCRSCHEWIVAGDDGFTVGWFDASGLCNKVFPTTTLAELKGM